MRRIALHHKWQTYKQALYQREITITNNETSALTDFQIPIEIGGDFLGKADPNNLIITDNDLILPYWVEQWRRPEGKARIWTRVSLDASASKTLKLFYGGYFNNPPNGDNVFEFFDDFDGSSLDTNKWTYNGAGTMSVQDSMLKLQTGTTQGTGPNIYGSLNVSVPLIAEVRKYAASWGAGDDRSATFYMEDSGSSNAFNFTLMRSVLGDYRIANKASGTWGSQVALATGLKLYTVYKVKTVFDGTNIVVSLLNDNGHQIASHTYSSFSFTPVLMRLQTWNNGSATNCIGFFDLVCIRKYTANEPSVSVGSGQQLVRSW